MGLLYIYWLWAGSLGQAYLSLSKTLRCRRTSWLEDLNTYLGRRHWQNSTCDIRTTARLFSFCANGFAATGFSWRSKGVQIRFSFSGKLGLAIPFGALFVAATAMSQLRSDFLPLRRRSEIVPNPFFSFCALSIGCEVFREYLLSEEQHLMRAKRDHPDSVWWVWCDAMPIRVQLPYLTLPGTYLLYAT